MKQLTVILTALLISLFISSCRKSIFPIRGKGDLVLQTRTLNDCGGIHLAMDAEVKIIKDSVYKLELSAQQNILDIITTDVSGGILTINTKNINLHNSKPITISVHMPSIKNVEISGSGNINSNDIWSAESFESRVSGSGNISLSGVTSTNIYSTISGSGNIAFLSGTSTNSYLKISGSGNCKSENLVTKNVEATVSGSGDIYCNAEDNLNATISGSGNIHYKGRPRIEQHISGSGNLITID